MDKKKVEVSIKDKGDTVLRFFQPKCVRVAIFFLRKKQFNL